MRTDWADEHEVDWKKYWMNLDGDTDIIYFVGGGIVYHHCIFWPALLRDAGYTLPRAVVASGMVKIGDKTCWHEMLVKNTTLRNLDVSIYELCNDRIIDRIIFSRFIKTWDRTYND